MTETITLLSSSGKEIPYRLRVSARARRLRITVSGGGVTVTLPKGVPLREAERFLRHHETWVLAQLEKASRQAKPTALPPDVILLHGEALQLSRIEEPGRIARSRVEISRGRVLVRLPAGSKLSTRNAAEAWLRQEARAEIEKVVIEEARRMGAMPKSVSIRDQRTRWGSCSSRGGLSFNWRLVMAPPEVLRYVVIHELGHLFEPNHSRDFWTLVARFFPDYKKARLWLRKNAAALRSD